MTKYVSEEYGIVIGNAHEDGDLKNEPIDKEMDEWNNAIGRKLAKDNPNASLELLRRLVMFLINMGIAKILRPKPEHERFVISIFRRFYSGKILDADASEAVLTNLYDKLYKDKSQLMIVLGSQDYREYNYKQIQQLLNVIFLLPTKKWKNEK
jgi:hypothetical protein